MENDKKIFLTLDEETFKRLEFLKKKYYRPSTNNIISYLINSNYDFENKNV